MYFIILNHKENKHLKEIYRLIERYKYKLDKTFSSSSFVRPIRDPFFFHDRHILVCNFARHEIIFFVARKLNLRMRNDFYLSRCLGYFCNGRE